jgi:hypothetical protein
VPIWEHGVKDEVKTHITFERLIPGCVPQFEEMEAARFGNYTAAAYEELPVEERARCVAHYRLSKLVELHISDAVNRATSQRMKRGK